MFTGFTEHSSEHSSRFKNVYMEIVKGSFVEAKLGVWRALLRS